MTIKQQGGIFGRNPTFNDVTVDGDLSTDSIVSTTSGTVIGTVTATAEGTLKVYDPDATFIIQDNTAGEASAFARMLIGESAAAGATTLDDCWQIAYDARYLTFSRIGSNGVSGTPTEEFRVSSGVGIVMANGSGIDFSATSDASGSTSELFNDYEEGTWTPTLSAYAGTPTTQGSYVKVGRVVKAGFKVILDGTSDASNFRITGLPFSFGSDGGPQYGDGAVISYIDSGTTDIRFLCVGTTDIMAYNSSGTILSYNTVGTSTEVRGVVIYTAA